jgi:hypothetical protein
MSKSKRHLIGLVDILKQADALQRGMPAAYLLTFVLVGLEEGETVAEYAKRAGVDRYAMSRYITLLGGRRYGWLQTRRVGVGKSVTLTPEGHALFAQMSDGLLAYAPRHQG